MLVKVLVVVCVMVFLIGFLFICCRTTATSDPPKEYRFKPGDLVLISDIKIPGRIAYKSGYRDWVVRYFDHIGTEQFVAFFEDELEPRSSDVEKDSP